MTLEGDVRELPRDIRRQLNAADAWRAWDVSASEYGARALAVGPERIFVIGESRGASLVTPWSDVKELSFHSALHLRVRVDDQEPQLVILKQLRHRDELLAAIPPSHLERLGLDDLPVLGVPTGRPATLAEPSATSPRRPTTRPTPTPAPEGDPQGTLERLFAVGLGLQVLGALLLGTAWPEAGEDGNATALVFGWLLSAAGSLALAVSLIGFGVSLGIRAARGR